MTNVEPQESTLRNETLVVYIGTYTRGESEGIYRCQLDLKRGALEQLAVAGKVANPSYLAIDAERHRLFAVNELSEFMGQPGGGISAFAIQPATGDLTLINHAPSHGDAPCYLTLDQAGRHLFAVNYMGGNLVVIEVGKDGALGLPTTIIAHAGSSRHATRQDAPHPHSIVLDPANTHAFVPDLGLDKVMQYRLDDESGLLTANQEASVATNPGAGPRHLVFGPEGQTAYVVGELDSSITAYAYDDVAGRLDAFQTVSMVPEGYAGPNLAADIHLTPDGRFLYASNRGHDSIAAFVVDQMTGALKGLGFTPTQGKSPRGFAIDPTGRYLLVANEHSDEILTFRIDKDEGTLSPTGYSLSVPSPVCLKLMPLDEDLGGMKSEDNQPTLAG